MTLLPIDGHTALVGLMAWPIGHTVSPPMHNAAFEALGLNWRYVPLPVPPEAIGAAVRGLVALGFRGANVTVPHKQAVLPTLDGVALDAARFGAVNTLVIDRDAESTTLTGHNTDYRGFVDSLRQTGFDPQGKRAVVVGAGGGARAVVFGLLQAGATEILVSDVVPEQARTLVADLGGLGGALQALTAAPEALVDSARAADLLVNATPVGMSPRADASIWPESTPVPPHLTVFDLVYNPQETQLLRQARESGAQPISGLEMLVRQGALAFELWTGQAAPIDVMRVACARALI